MSKSGISRNLKLMKEALFKENLFHVPVLNLHTYYCDRNEILENEIQPYRVMVKFDDKVCNVEEAAKAYFEKQGFTVLEGTDVNTFFWFFLLQIPESEFDEKLSFQVKQRNLIKQYLAGEVVFEKVIGNAISNATLFYLPPEKQNRELSKKIFDIVKTLRLPSFSGSDKSEIQRSNRQRMLDLLANDFLPRYLRKSHLKKLALAYPKMISGSPPDLFVYNPKKRLWFFVEVKSLSDKLNKSQWDWIMHMQKHLKDHVLLLRVLPLERQFRRGDF